MGKCVNVSALVLLLFLITLFTGCSSSCSTETLLTADRLYSRTLRSPNYPSNYFNNQECVWRIRAESWRFTVRLYVADIRLENVTDCRYDSLSFYDGGLASNDNLLAKLCGTSGLRRYFYSSGWEILVKFKSDSSGTYRGFSLVYKAVRRFTTVPTTITTTTPDNLSCWTGRTLIASSFNNGTLVSTNYPRNYPNNQECVWRIRAESWGFTVRLYVADIRLESDPDCRYDSLSFFDGGMASNDNLLAKLCGASGLRRYFYSSGREIMVKFKSDSSGTYRGFSLVYKAVRRFTTVPTTITTTTPDNLSCWTERTLTASSFNNGTLVSTNYPRNYPNNQQCVWRIRAESWRFIVRLYVADISVEYDHDCRDDSLSFYDGGLASNDNLLAKLCGTSGLNSYFYSSGQEILVKFKSDSSGTYRGFRLTYKAVRTTTTTTTTPDHYCPSGDDSKESFTVGTVMGTVAIMLVAIAVVICYHRKCKHQAIGHSAAAPRVTTSTTTTTASVPRAGANNNSSRSQQQVVYVLPANQPSTRPAGVVAGRGHTNAAYSPAAGEPLPHSFQLLPSLSPSAPPVPDVTIPRQTADVAMSPPSYNEVMMMEEGTQPPSYEEVGGADTLVMTSSDDAAVRNNSSRHDD